MKKYGKKWIAWVCALILTAVLLPIQRAEAASASLSGGTYVTAGRSFTLTLSLNGRSLLGTQAFLRYDPAILELTGYDTLRANWSIEMNDDKISAYGVNNPINSNAPLMTLTFRVHDGVAEDTRFSVSICDGLTSDEKSDTVLPEYTWMGCVTRVMGDVTEDGHVDAADVTALARYVAGRSTLPTSAQLLADVDGSGTVNKNDLTALLRFVSGITDQMG